MVTAEVEDDEVVEIIAGKVDPDHYKTAKIKIKEKIPGSLLLGRTIDFELSEGAKLTVGKSVDITSDKSDGAFGASKKTVAFKTNAKTGSKWDTDQYEKTSLDVEISGSSAEAQTLEIEIPFTVEANYTGDIYVTVKVQD